MAKKNWYETINDRVPAELNVGLDFPSLKNDLSSLFKGWGSLSFTDEEFGFQDKGNHYEMVTELGGNGDIKEDAVKIELLHDSEYGEKKAGAYIKVTYEHKTETEHSHYSHSQTTSVTLPRDADEETVSAHFDDENRVVITVKKLPEPKMEKSCRNIPIKGV